MAAYVHTVGHGPRAAAPRGLAAGVLHVAGRLFVLLSRSLTPHRPNAGRPKMMMPTVLHRLVRNRSRSRHQQPRCAGSGSRARSTLSIPIDGISISVSTRFGNRASHVDVGGVDRSVYLVGPATRSVCTGPDTWPHRSEQRRTQLNLRSSVMRHSAAALDISGGDSFSDIYGW